MSMLHMETPFSDSFDVPYRSVMEKIKKDPRKKLIVVDGEVVYHHCRFNGFSFL